MHLLSRGRARARELWERAVTGLYSMPWVMQLWARWAVQRSQRLDASAAIPFVPFSGPLAQARAALVTTAGIHLPHQPPFDMDDPEGDASYREIPGDVDLRTVVITHKYYDHRDADADPNIVFPLDHFRDLARQGVIGAVNHRHFSFMGHIEGPHLERLIQETGPEVAAKLRADRVDFAFLTPA